MESAPDQAVLSLLRQMQAESLNGFERIEVLVGDIATRVSTLEFHYAAISRDFAEVRVVLDRHDRRLRLIENPPVRPDGLSNFDVL